MFARSSQQPLGSVEETGKTASCSEGNDLGLWKGSCFKKNEMSITWFQAATKVGQEGYKKKTNLGKLLY